MKGKLKRYILPAAAAGALALLLAALARMMEVHEVFGAARGSGRYL